MCVSVRACVGGYVSCMCKQCLFRNDSHQSNHCLVKTSGQASALKKSDVCDLHCALLSE